MPPWTPSPPVSVLAPQCLRLSEREQMQLCRDAEYENVTAFASVTPQTRGQMMRNMSVMWAGRPSRLAATS